MSRELDSARELIATFNNPVPPYDDPEYIAMRLAEFHYRTPTPKDPT